MNKFVVLILLFASSAHAQLVLEQRYEFVPRNQNFVVNPCPASCWDAKRYGPQYNNIAQVPPHIRAQVDSPPARVISLPIQVVVPTQQNLPGQTEQERRFFESK